jgi:hypothetical protein
MAGDSKFMTRYYKMMTFLIPPLKCKAINVALMIKPWQYWKVTFYGDI